MAGSIFIAFNQFLQAIQIIQACPTQYTGKEQQIDPVCFFSKFLKFSRF